MSTKLDWKGAERAAINHAISKMVAAADRAIAALGTDGENIRFDRSDIRRVGNNVTFGTMEFPSDEVRARFTELYRSYC